MVGEETHLAESSACLAPVEGLVAERLVDVVGETAVAVAVGDAVLGMALNPKLCQGQAVEMASSFRVFLFAMQPKAQSQANAQSISNSKP